MDRDRETVHRVAPILQKLELEGDATRFRALPPMSTHDHAVGEVHSLEHYGKFKLFESSTAHAGMEEMQIDLMQGTS